MQKLSIILTACLFFSGFAFWEVSSVGAKSLPQTSQEIREAMRLIRQGQDAEAYILLGQVLKENPDSVDGLLALGMIKVQKGEFATAKLNFQKVVSQRPYSVAANYMLAMIYEREENDTAALAAWQRVFSRARRGGNLSELAAKHIRQLKEIIGETR